MKGAEKGTDKRRRRRKTAAGKPEGSAGEKASGKRPPGAVGGGAPGSRRSRGPHLRGARRDPRMYQAFCSLGKFT